MLFSVFLLCFTATYAVTGMLYILQFYKILEKKLHFCYLQYFLFDNVILTVFFISDIFLQSKQKI